MKVSVIVPIYNVESYVRECIESIINQTLEDIEVILVNDGSTDRSIEIIEDLLTIHKNIILINKENGGLSSARNTGLSYATGDYVCFVDSDDYLHPNYLQFLYNEAVNNKLDVAVGGYCKKLIDGSIIQVARKQELINLGVISGKNYLYNQLLIDDYQMEVWDDLYDRHFLVKYNLNFCEGLIHEDEEFTPKVFLLAERVKVIGQYGYIYRQRSGSIMSNLPTLKNIEGFNYTIDSLCNHFNNEKDEEIKVVLSLLINNLVKRNINKISIGNITDKTYLLRKMSHKSILKIMNYSKKNTLKEYVRYKILFIFPNEYLKIRGLKTRFFNKSF